MLEADDDPAGQRLIVVFDDDMTTLDNIKKAMEREGFPVEGDPEFLKQ